MQITKAHDNDSLTMFVEGRLDAVTSTAFDAEVTGVPAAVKKLPISEEDKEKILYKNAEKYILQSRNSRCEKIARAHL